MKKLLNISINLILPLLIIAGGLLIAKYQLDNKPEAKKRKPEKQARLVTAESFRKGDYPAEVRAMGTAQPARTVSLRPEVSGKVEWIADRLIPGSFVQSGSELVHIEKTDYLSDLEKAQSALSSAKADLEIQKGNVRAARSDYEMMGEKLSEEDKALVLKKPQLRKAEANVKSAEAALARAKKNYERCVIKAPFDARINEKNVELGELANASAGVLELVGTEAAWIEVLVPEKQLKWIELPQKSGNEGSKVKIYNDSVWPADAFREGSVLRLIGTLEKNGRMARVLVEAEDPFCLNEQNKGGEEILFGAYLRCRIHGRTIEDVFRLKRRYIHDNNTLWVVGEDNKLEIRKAEIVFREHSFVYVKSGITESDTVVTSDIAAPVEGMPLRISEAAAEENAYE
ncbi:efflux RND transporter periplasmic adaptor subunit [Sedimentisphaera salicampi]|uniref:Efflux pump periplasmic linker BepF n=1 Tax=Sedimentisphaera salicampi TaxID=1941349 RepID=A0A1W6LNK9_9BACT|nr:efflux RND transporter periplasmic adaptor subunit [Sedimentisphaera salicampi]ARN57390.1 Efflux pump periplasmic linker BepF [Sedimentisphaera salicampi]OXU14535.1 Efflux pump periplasmic linker BepF [Sedimentisphaera salicampi]